MKNRRKMVEVDQEYYRQFEALKRECRKRGKAVPTIRQLVNVAILAGIKTVIDAHWPRQEEQ